MKKIYVVFVATALLALVLPAVAQECSMQTVTGVYFYQGFGQSFMGGPPAPITTPPNPTAGVLPLHAPGTYLNGTQLGVFTVHPDGAVDTITWVAMGPFRQDPAGDRLPARVTSIGRERTPEGEELGCVATIEYNHPQSGPGQDKFIVYDNGNEIRGVHAMNGNPITTSIYVGKRITRTLDAAPRCGTQTLKGSYVATCPRSLLYNSNGTTLSIASMLDLKMLPDAEVVGMLFNRIENRPTETPVQGRFSVNADCTGEGYLYGLLPGSPAKALVTLFTYDQGKGAFLFPTELELPDGSRVPYPTTQSCTLEQTDPK
jgi:hypothetical protein